MEQTTGAGDGIKVEINQGAMERIEAAAAAGVRQALAARLDKIITETIEGVVDERITAAIGKLTEDAVIGYLTKPRMRTNHYGEPIGGTTMTIADQIPDKVEKYLMQRVNSRGEPETYGGEKHPTRVDFMIGKFVRDELDVATKKAAADVTEKAKQVVAAHVSRFVSEQMIPQIEVNGRA